VHRHDEGNFFPGTGHHLSCGVGMGVGRTVNVGWPGPGFGDADYMLVFDKILLPIANSFNPQLVIVSAGFDCALGDPIGGMRVTPEGFGRMTRRLQSLANGKLVLALEGGYDLVTLSDSIVHCVKALLGDFIEPALPSESAPLEKTYDIIQEVISIQSKYWPILNNAGDNALLYNSLKSPPSLLSSANCKNPSAANQYHKLKVLPHDVHKKFQNIYNHSAVESLLNKENNFSSNNCYLKSSLTPSSSSSSDQDCNPIIKKQKVGVEWDITTKIVSRKSPSIPRIVLSDSPTVKTNGCYNNGSTTTTPNTTTSDSDVMLPLPPTILQTTDNT